MGLDDDIARYADAARRHGEAMAAGDSAAANAAYRTIDNCWRRLQVNVAHWQPLFVKLLSDLNPWVRLWSASHALKFEEGAAIVVLEELAQHSGALGLDAEMTLKVWRRGGLNEYH